MDLVYNADPRFTKYIVESGAMKGKFVVVDVGVYGGPFPFKAIPTSSVALQGIRSQRVQYYLRFPR
jgi:hypothetical protein